MNTVDVFGFWKYCLYQVHSKGTFVFVMLMLTYALIITDYGF